MPSIADSPANSRPAKLPAIVIPAGLDRSMAALLAAVKERLEVREGERGNPFERSVTVRDLVDAGVDVVVVGGSRLQPRQKAENQVQADNQHAMRQQLTEDRIRRIVEQEFARLVALEFSKLDSRLEALEREQGGRSR